MKTQKHLPVFGVGPIYVFIIAVLTFAAYRMRNLAVLSSGRIDMLQKPLLILGIVLIVLGVFIWFQGAVVSRMLDGIVQNRLNYDDYSKPLSPAKKTAFIFTMNIPESLFDDFWYRPLFQRYENWMKLYFGHCEMLLSTDTLQVKDYSRQHLAGFDAEAKHLRHETVFPQDCQRVFELGKRLVE